MPTLQDDRLCFRITHGTLWRHDRKEMATNLHLFGVLGVLVSPGLGSRAKGQVAHYGGELELLGIICNAAFMSISHGLDREAETEGEGRYRPLVLGARACVRYHGSISTINIIHS
jgi:hypothetical protein